MNGPQFVLSLVSLIPGLYLLVKNKQPHLLFIIWVNTDRYCYDFIPSTLNEHLDERLLLRQQTKCILEGVKSYIYLQTFYVNLNSPLIR